MPARRIPAPVSTRTSVLDDLVFGVDVQSGDVRGDRPSYALVRFDGERIERDVVSHRKLRRLIQSEEPALVATDNMYELAENKDALVGLLRELPAETRLVQVTGAERPEPLSRVASRAGVPYGKDPMQEAEAAARLAARNVGYEVAAFEDETTVKVSRGRSTGKGGWSEDRFTRRIHGAVRGRAREIESELDAAGLDYEREVTEKYGGYSRAEFLVEAPPSEIPVSAERFGDVRIEIEQPRTDGIEFRPLVKRRDHVVVGVDPGTTTAVALVDLDGRMLDVYSTRTASTAEIIEWIIERGRPVVVAADVTPMPNTVEKIRRSFDAAGWIPERDLPIDRKQHRTREHAYDDDHQRDALAAALFAHDDHADQFERITQKVPPEIDRGEVIARVLSDEESVEAVLADLQEDDEPEEESSSEAPPGPSPEQQRITQLEAQVERLREHVADLEGTVERKDARIDELEDELETARRKERQEVRERREVARLRRETKRLERDLEAERERADELEGKLARLKELWKLDHSNFTDVAAEKQGLVPVKVVEQFTKEAIREADESFGLAPDDVIYLRDASGAGRSTAEMLADVEPRVVLRGGGLSEAADRVLFERDVPVAPAEAVTIQEVDELAVARESEVEGAIAGWEEQAERRRLERNREMVDQLISEHRAREGQGSSD